MQLNGTLQFLNSKNMTEAGALDLIDEDGDFSDVEDRRRTDAMLPGSNRGDISARSTRPEIRVTSVKFSPTANAFACATTEGLLVYSVDSAFIFDPFDLDMDVTPESTLAVLKDGEFLTALVMAFRLNERYLIHKVYESVKFKDIPLIAKDLPIIYVEKLFSFIGSIAMESQHIEFNLIWISNLLTAHGYYNCWFQE
ncbi:unnamed protein product [Ambrosiozyma monospora]|uniref:Unnamed protein product n=1 Tax=Ambrosiozyma monospora TaxID=43982 RepID=A0ACB5U9F8_AMBMO|nr:unnamed protein product [Ambrosiozyma monospora]